MEADIDDDADVDDDHAEDNGALRQFFPSDWECECRPVQLRLVRGTKGFACF